MGGRTVKKVRIVKPIQRRRLMKMIKTIVDVLSVESEPEEKALQNVDLQVSSCSQGAAVVKSSEGSDK